MGRVKSIPGLSALIACVALLLIWDALSRAFAVSGLPPPWGALRELPNLLSDPETLVNILASLKRMAIGFLVAIACAVPIGLMMGRSRAVAAFFNPLL
ncbi:MAG: ABC transporter permease, partial [Xanthobacteraceae bacterium]|nr:ABC transporter permease [Xanthobacteraceae bacterium]